MISGREAIKAFWSDLVASAHAKSALLSSIDIMPAGDGVVEIGRAVLTMQAPEHPEAELEVKYGVFWRQEGGSWKWHADIWNRNA